MAAPHHDHPHARGDRSHTTCATSAASTSPHNDRPWCARESPPDGPRPRKGSATLQPTSFHGALRAGLT